MSGFVTSGFSAGGGEGAVGAIKMAIVGGTVAEIGGGKFANGAMGSAFQYLFNTMTQAEIDAHNRDYRNPDKVWLGDRTTDWHQRNGEIAMSMMKAGAVRVGAGVAIEATYTYMYMNPEAAVKTIGIIESLDGYYGGNAPGPNLGSAVNGFENFTGISIVPDWLKQ